MESIQNVKKCYRNLQKNKFQILAMEVMPDHIHLLVYIEGQKEKGKRKKPDRRNGLLEEKRCRQYPAMA